MDEPAPAEESAPVEEPAYSQDVTQAAPAETTDTETGTESDYSGTESDYSGTESDGTESDYSEPETTYTDTGETQTADSEADPTDGPSYEQQVEQTDQAVDDYQSETDITQTALGGGESQAGDELSGETPDYSAWAPDLSVEQDSSDLWTQMPVSAAALCCCDVASGPAAGDDLLVAPIAAGSIETPVDTTAISAASGPGVDSVHATAISAASGPGVAPAPMANDGSWVAVGGQGLGTCVRVRPSGRRAGGRLLRDCGRRRPPPSGGHRVGRPRGERPGIRRGHRSCGWPRQRPWHPARGSRRGEPSAGAAGAMGGVIP